jgi:dTDP-4-amino-4,6-dideoxygalactose transaminase
MEKARSLCLHGISRDAWNRYSDQGKWYYEVTDIGFKYNLSDILAAIGIHQLRRQEEFIARRKQIAERYTEAFAQMEELIPPREKPDTRHAWHLYLLRLSPRYPASRDELIRELYAAGVQCSVHFIPITQHPAYDGHPRVVRASFERCEQFYRASLSLPLYPAMTDADVEFVIQAVTDAVARHRVRRVAASASG